MNRGIGVVLSTQIEVYALVLISEPQGDVLGRLTLLLLSNPPPYPHSLDAHAANRLPPNGHIPATATASKRLATLDVLDHSLRLALQKLLWVVPNFET